MCEVFEIEFAAFRTSRNLLSHFFSHLPSSVSRNNFPINLIQRRNFPSFSFCAFFPSFTQVLMEGTPEYLDYTEIMTTFLSIDGVVRVHNLRIWVRGLKENPRSIIMVL